MLKIFLLALGGAVGTLARYFMAGAVQSSVNTAFPAGTLAVNLTGSLIIGILWGLFENVPVAPELRVFLFVGLLGGFTTFSSFSLENFHMLRDNEIIPVIINVTISVVGGILLAYGGYFLSKMIFRV